MSPGDLTAFSLQGWRKLSFVWKYQIVFWTIYTVVSFPVHFIGLRYVLHWQAPFHGIVFLKVAELVASILVTWGGAWMMESRWFRKQGVARKTISTCVAVALITLLGETIIRPAIVVPIFNYYGSYQRARDSKEGAFKRFAQGSFQVVLYGGWAWIFLLVRASVEAKDKERELHASELKRREAEILILRSQLDPHFLFNAMNTIAYESGGNEKIDHLVEGISDYLRYSLATRTRTHVPLGEEIEATRRYLEVQAIRLGKAFEFEINADPSSSQIPVPGIFLQPLVENALKYGGKGTPPPLRIRVTARCRGEDLHVEVANTGLWISPSTRTGGAAGGVGLENLKARLGHFYPDRFELEIRSDDGWTTIDIIFKNPRSFPDNTVSPFPG